MEGFESFTVYKNEKRYFLNAEYSIEIKEFARKEWKSQSRKPNIIEVDNSDLPEPINKPREGYLPTAIPEITTETKTKNNNSVISTLIESNEFLEIKNLYLKLSSKASLSAKDELAIIQVMDLKLEQKDLINLIKQCFKQQTTTGDSTKIWSFKFILNYIKKNVRDHIMKKDAFLISENLPILE